MFKGTKAKFSGAAKKVAAGVVALSGAASAFAQTAPSGPDFSSLTSSINLSSVSTGVLAVAGILIGVYVTIKGAKILMSMVKGS